MRKLVVADTHLHARAMIKWLNLDPAKHMPIAYGEEIVRFYQAAYLVRPLRGITQENAEWVLRELRPRIVGTISRLTESWTPEPPPEREDGPAFARNPLWN